MGILIMWLGTIAMSLFMKVTLVMRIIKDIADAGYKFDIERLEEIKKEADPRYMQSMFMPFFNIFAEFFIANQYFKNRSRVIDSYWTLNVLKEMTEEEKREYEKNPSGLNALVILSEEQVRMKKAASIKIENKEGMSEIFFLVDENEDIVILKATGPVAQLTEEEQKAKLIEAGMEVLKAGLQKYDDIDSLIDDLEKNSSISVTIPKSDEIKEPEELSYSGEIEKVPSEEMENKEKNEGPSLTRKRK